MPVHLGTDQGEGEMSDITHRYFLIEGEGPALKAATWYMDGMLAYHEHVKSMKKRYGASGVYHNGTIIGLAFLEGCAIPDGFHHKTKHPHAVYSPYGATKAGKAAKVLLESVRQPNWMMDINGARAWMMFTSDRVVVPLPEMINKTLIWRMPVSEDGRMPEMPMDGLREISASEYWAMKEKPDLSS